MDRSGSPAVNVIVGASKGGGEMSIKIYALNASIEQLLQGQSQASQ